MDRGTHRSSGFVGLALVLILGVVGAIFLNIYIFQRASTKKANVLARARDQMGVTAQNALAVADALLRIEAFYLANGTQLVADPAIPNGPNWAFTPSNPALGNLSPANPATLVVNACDTGRRYGALDLANIHGGALQVPTLDCKGNPSLSTTLRFVGVDAQGWLQTLIDVTRGGTLPTERNVEARLRLPKPKANIALLLGGGPMASVDVPFNTSLQLVWWSRNAVRCFGYNNVPLNSPADLFKIMQPMNAQTNQVYNLVSRALGPGSSQFGGTMTITNSPIPSLNYHFHCWGSYGPNGGTVGWTMSVGQKDANEKRYCFGAGGPQHVTAFFGDSGSAMGCKGQIASGAGAMCDPDPDDCASCATYGTTRCVAINGKARMPPWQAQGNGCVCRNGLKCGSGVMNGWITSAYTSCGW